MLRWYPYVPVGGEMAVNCAILSYDGNVYFGFSGDVHAAPDLRRLETLLTLNFEELREAAGGKPAQKKRTRAGKTAAKSVPVETVRIQIPVPASLPYNGIKARTEINASD
jgi:hypothetical protein